MKTNTIMRFPVGRAEVFSSGMVTAHFSTGKPSRVFLFTIRNFLPFRKNILKT